MKFSEISGRRAAAGLTGPAAADIMNAHNGTREERTLMNMTIRFKKLRPQAQAPDYGSAGAAGADLRACLDAPVTIQPGETKLLPLGLAVEIPEGYVGLVYARSGLAAKRGIAPANKVGVIDSDFRGELTAALHNHGREPQVIEPGDRVLQMVITPCVQAAFEEADELPDTQRGAGGWGSTGR